MNAKVFIGTIIATLLAGAGIIAAVIHRKKHDSH